MLSIHRRTAAPVHPVLGTGGEHEPHGLETLGNPYVLRESFAKLDHALTEVITTIQGEERSVGAATSVDALVRKFSSWRDELTNIRTGHGQRGAGAAAQGEAVEGEAVEGLEQQEGGLFAE